MALELDHEYEGVGASILNPRFDWLVEEHGPKPQTYTISADTHPALFAAQVFTASAAAVPFEGHDGSHYQWDAGVAARVAPPVDLDALARMSKIIWWKCTQSISYVDPTFTKIWGPAGYLFPRRIAYHWLSPATDPEQQAAHLCAVLDSLGGPKEGDAIMIDSEEAGVTDEKCWVFAEWVERHYDRPIVSDYSGLYVDGGRIWNSERLREGNYGHRPMHLAAYVLEPRLNQLMTQLNAKPYDAWQYWSGGPVPGIVGRADMNTHINFAAYDLICQKQATPTPPPLPPPPPLQGEEMSVLDTPVRVWDSRPGSPQGGNGKHGQGETFLVNIAAKSPPPANARGVIVSLHVLDGEGPGFLSVWGAGGQPNTSNINFTTGEVKDSLAVVPLSGGGINTFTSARCNVIVDVQGWVA